MLKQVEALSSQQCKSPYTFSKHSNTILQKNLSVDGNLVTAWPFPTANSISIGNFLVHIQFKFI